MADDSHGGRERPSTDLGSPPRRARLTFLSLFAVLAAAMMLWGLATPPMASADEPAHVVRAAAVVRGDLTGDADRRDLSRASVDVPALYAYAMDVPTCFAFNSNATAACIPPAPPAAEQGSTEAVSTWVARNNPLYYAVVGLPTLVADGPVTFALMRAVSAVLCALVLAWALRTLAGVTGSRWLVLGAMAATTPMVLFLGSTVNPGGLEIVTALALWVAVLALLRDPGPARLRARSAGVAVLVALLANLGTLGPLWAVLVVLAAVATGPRAALRVLVSDRRSWWWLLAAAAGLAVAVAWSAVAGRLSADAPGSGPGLVAAARRALDEVPTVVPQLVGVFGWLDTPLPQWLYLLLFVGIAFPVVLALLVAPRRDVLGVLAVLAVGLAAPVLVQTWQADEAVSWQGRYSLPLLVGVPVLAAFVLRDAGADLPRGLSRPALLVAPLAVLVAGHVCAFGVALHRYVRGTGNSWFLVLPTDWSPPLPPLILVGGNALALAALAALLLRASRPVEPVEPAGLPVTDTDADDQRADRRAAAPAATTR